MQNILELLAHLIIMNLITKNRCNSIYQTSSALTKFLIPTILADDEHSIGTTMTGVSAATSVGGVEGDDKEDAAKEKENVTKSKNDDNNKDKISKDDSTAMEYKNNAENNNNKDKDKSQEDNEADMDQDNDQEEPLKDVSMKIGDAATNSVTAPKGIKQAVVISPEVKHNISEQENILVLYLWALWTKNTRPDVCSRRKKGMVERKGVSWPLGPMMLHTKLLSIN